MPIYEFTCKDCHKTFGAVAPGLGSCRPVHAVPALRQPEDGARLEQRLRDHRQEELTRSLCRRLQAKAPRAQSLKTRESCRLVGKNAVTLEAMPRRTERSVAFYTRSLVDVAFPHVFPGTRRPFERRIETAPLKAMRTISC